MSGASGTLGALRRNRGIVLLVLVVLGVITVLSVVTARSAVRGADLDPQNPSPNGAQAVARVLAAHGVEVTVVRRAAELDRTAVDADTTVLVTSTGNLGRATARGVGVRTGSAGAVVLAAPGSTLIRALGLPVVADAAQVGSRTAARCEDPLLSGLALDVGASAGYRAVNADQTRSAEPGLDKPDRPGVVTPCFTGTGRKPASLVVRVDRATATYAVGGDSLFTNQRVDRADNAAAALRLLGQHDRLVWYVPDIRDVESGDAGSLAAQLPGGLVPGLWLLAAATLATMLWRGRRLGALVVEPLPVVVKAVESTQGRGRLYRRVRDRSHAAGILRTATIRRLTTHLRLPAGTDEHQLVSSIAASTGREQQAVYDVLVRRPVADDRALTRLASELAALEKEVLSP